ncbi:hypothetical protein [Desulfosporosinus metallidurans]|uniref:hypothetical protein n=1 Tax=Desulfosporosinus metallidurans TaxID=1888891 RepID=UPI001F1D7E6E|nr:hypothetical protein [Desulfosporosinus metallidurans]
MALSDLVDLAFHFLGRFFVPGGLLNQLTLNFALFYPLGFLVGYRPRLENRRTAYVAAFLFNCSSYLIAVISGVSIDNWTIVILDFVSLILFLEAGRIIGKRAQSKE